MGVKLLMVFTMLAEEPPHLDPQATYVLGGLAGLAAFFFFVMRGINETRTFLSGRKPAEQLPVSAPVPSPLVVTTQPVFATIELVEKGDKQLKDDIAKLDKYVHESIHAQAKEIQGVATLIKDSDEAHRDAIEDVNKQGETRISGVHTRLNEMDRTIGGLSADTKTANSNLVEVQRTLNILLSRTASSPRRGGGSDV